MIRALSESLRALVEDPRWKSVFPELGDAHLAFDGPVDDKPPSAPTLDLFLFDVRENMELRSNEPQLTRANGMVTLARPPLRVACSYLVTARSAGAAGPELALQEHRLLGQALQLFSSFPTLPGEYLQGRLAGQVPPLPLVTARADGLKEPSEFWAALGARLRPSIVVTATISLEPIAPPLSVHEVSSSTITIGQRAAADRPGLVPGNDLPTARIGGRVTWSADHAPVAGATVTLVERGLVSATDEHGTYQIGALPPGRYTLRVRCGKAAKTLKAIVLGKKSPAFDVELTGSAPQP
jgi:hypothetical protein